MNSELQKDKIDRLEKKARELRRNIITMIYTAKSGHPGGSLSAADFVTCLYFDELNVEPKNPKMRNRDRLILSKGHCCPVVYSALIMRGFMPPETLYSLRKLGSPLQGHPDMTKAAGIEFSTGSLGQGLSAAVGMAFGYKYDRNDGRIYAIVGDGETQEGQIHEAALSAAKYKLDNLVCIIDANGLQNDGHTCEMMPTLEPLADRWKAYGWEVLEIDGHDIQEILDALELARKVKGRPTCIIARTIKGKGVSYMEDVCEWHGGFPNDEEYEIAMKELGA